MQLLQSQSEKQRERHCEQSQKREEVRLLRHFVPRNDIKNIVLRLRHCEPIGRGNPLNKPPRHPEFISGYMCTHLKNKEMLKPVQHDMKKVAFTSPSKCISKSESRTTTNKNDAFSCERYRLTRGRNDNQNKKCAFTLAEVLITLGIIGIVAAMTLPAIMQGYQKMVLKNQFKKVYSMLNQALLKSAVDWGSKPDCYYWDKSPYSGQYWCEEYNPTTGICVRYNNPLPNDYNGNMGDCTALRSVMEKNLKILKTCLNNAHEKGCIPEYEGVDTVLQANNPDLPAEDVITQTGGCIGWRRSSILNDRRSIVLADGTIILYYSAYQLFAVDINGKRKPNKWGHDIFAFQLKSNDRLPLKLSPSTLCSASEKDGVSTAQMLIDIYKK